MHRRSQPASWPRRRPTCSRRLRRGFWGWWAALDDYLVTVCDHGMNASTFTTRVVASTQADLFAAVTAGYCALTGPLHGGAPEPVLEMLDAIGTCERIKPWVDSALARGERLMGFGHRIYRVRDPRE